MRLYECMFILRDRLSDEERDALLNKVKKIITDNKGEIIEFKEWGRRELAYKIKKESVGIYYLLRYNAPPDAIREIDRLFKLEDNILRHFITRIEKEDLEYFPPPEEGNVEEAGKEV